VPNATEAWGQSVVSWVRFGVELGIYVAPLILPYVYRRLEAAASDPKPLADLALSLGCLYAFGLLLRAWGRSGNEDYLKFAEVLREAKSNFDKDGKRALRRFDFEFWAWPVEFNASRYYRVLRRTNSLATHLSLSQSARC